MVKRNGVRLRDRLLEGLSWRRMLLILLGAMIMTFGIHNIHHQVGITEGGVIGMMLLVDHWTGFSPAYITPVLDIACYILAFKYLGGQFIKVSVLSTLSVSAFYKVWEQFPPMLPDLSGHPPGRFQRRGRRAGAGHLEGHPLAALPRLPLHRLYRAGPFAHLHPGGENRLLGGDGDGIVLPDRPGAGF